MTQLAKAMLLGISLLVLGCQQHTAEKAAPPSPAERQRRLALAEPGGTAVVDQLITRYQEAVRHRPDKLDPWVLLGRAWVRKARESAEPGFFLNAAAAADLALNIKPDAPVALDLKGLVLLNDHRFAEARDLAQKIVAARPDDPMAYGTLSDAWLELGEFQKAAEAAQKMVDLKPNLPSYSRASYLRWLGGDTENAKEFMRLAIDASAPDRRDPEPRAWALTQAALYFWHQGDYGGAEAGFDMALQLLPEYAPALVGKARSVLGRGDGKAAAQLLDRAYRQSPLPETAWLLGDARTLLGDAPGAAAAYERVERQGRRTDPRTLALFYATRNTKPAEALRLAEEERGRRGDTYTRDVYAFALYRAGRIAEARKEIDEALRLGTRDARLLYHQGAIHLASGDAAGGRKLLRQALALNPKFDLGGAADAARLLGER